MKRFLPWLPAAAWAALLFFLSSRPSLPSPGVQHFDKVAHFGAYAVLGLLLAYAARRAGGRLRTAVLLGVAYGASDELHQWFVAGRSASLLDWVADAAGVAVAVFLFARWRARRAVPHTPDENALRA